MKSPSLPKWPPDGERFLRGVMEALEPQLRAAGRLDLTTDGVRTTPPRLQA